MASTTNFKPLLPVINLKRVPGHQHTRASIIAEMSAVLRHADASTTNIDSAIARTTVSAHDISAIFGSKRELFLAMVSELFDSVSAPLNVCATKSDLRQRLVEFAQAVADTYSTSHLRCLYRIAISESCRHTGLAGEFYKSGPGRLTKRLADYLRIAQHEGALGCADPHLLASHFLAPLQTSLDVTDDSSRQFATHPAARSAYVRNMVDLFCDGLNGEENCVEAR